MSAICGPQSKQLLPERKPQLGKSLDYLLAGPSYLEHCPLKCPLSLWVSPQTRQIARKIFTDFCHVVSFGLEIPWTRICFNSA